MAIRVPLPFPRGSRSIRLETTPHMSTYFSLAKPNPETSTNWKMDESSRSAKFQMISTSICPFVRNAGRQIWATTALSSSDWPGIAPALGASPMGAIAKWPNRDLTRSEDDSQTEICKYIVTVTTCNHCNLLNYFQMLAARLGIFLRRFSVVLHVVTLRRGGCAGGRQRFEPATWLPVCKAIQSYEC